MTNEQGGQEPQAGERDMLIGLCLRFVGVPNAGADDPYYQLAAKEVERYLESRPAAAPEALDGQNATLMALLDGCGNHGCVVKAPTGMATNGPCRCARRLREMRDQLIGGPA